MDAISGRQKMIPWEKNVLKMFFSHGIMSLYLYGAEDIEVTPSATSAKGDLKNPDLRRMRYHIIDNTPKINVTPFAPKRIPVLPLKYCMLKTFI